MIARVPFWAPSTPPLTGQSKKAAPRVAFGTIVENGLLLPGAVLSDARRRFRATVRADGSIVSDAHEGSIHKVGSLVQGAPACNGWTFWHVRMGKELVAIDMLRQKVRAEIGDSLQ